MAIDTIEGLLTQELRDIYDAEKQITKALPKMVKGAASPELKEALQEHLEITKKQIMRLEQVFETLDEKPRGKTCNGMKGLLEEGREVMEEDSEESLLDAAIIGAAQKVEHYEIAAYGTLRSYAEKLGNEEAVRLLDETLEEEKEADRKLTEIAEGLLNDMDASSEEQDEEMEEEEEAPKPARTRRAS